MLNWWYITWPVGFKRLIVPKAVICTEKCVGCEMFYFPSPYSRGALLSQRKVLPYFRVKELSHLLNRRIETNVQSQETLASTNCINTRLLMQSVAALARSLAGVMSKEQQTVRTARRVVCLYCKNLWLNYTIARTSGWITPLQEPLSELLHCKKLWLNYFISGTPDWVTKLQEPLAQLLHYRNLRLSHSIVGTSGWVTPLQEPLAESLHCRKLWPSHFTAGTSAWVSQLQEPLAESLHCRNLWLSHSILGTSGWITLS